MGFREGGKDLLALDARRDIYELVQRAPGTHLRGVERELQLPLGQILYHLDYLERKEMLVAKKDGGFKRYFLRNRLSRREKDYAAAFRHTVPRRVTLHLLTTPGLTHRDLLDHVDVSASTLSFHLAKMVENGVLERVTGNGETRYTVADAAVATDVLVEFKESFRDAAVDAFTESHVPEPAEP
jgi:predicted transcriptional regulator